jgi:hypothetical protein
MWHPIKLKARRPTSSRTVTPKGIWRALTNRPAAVASGGSPLAAAAAGLLVNARHIPFGVTVRELVGRRALDQRYAGAAQPVGRFALRGGGLRQAKDHALVVHNVRAPYPFRGDRARTGWSARLKLYRVPHYERRERGADGGAGERTQRPDQRYAGAAQPVGRFALRGGGLRNDESVVFGLSQPTPAQRKAAYWLCGAGVALIWPCDKPKTTLSSFIMWHPIKLKARRPTSSRTVTPKGIKRPTGCAAPA